MGRKTGLFKPVWLADYLNRPIIPSDGEEAPGFGDGVLGEFMKDMSDAHRGMPLATWVCLTFFLPNRKEHEY
jgi:hypothetical protein